MSAGALAGGLWASGLSAAWIAEELAALRRADFWDPGLPLGGLLRGRKFGERMRRLCDERGVVDIEDCATPFAAVIHDVLSGRPVAVTRGPLAPAIVASCAVPLMFRPRLRNLRPVVDGGVSDREGLCARRPGERTLVHALPSRSPWRRLVPGSRQAAARAGAAGRSGGRGGTVPRMGQLFGDEETTTLVIDGLPRVTPFHLERGPQALARARAAARRLLAGPRGGS